VPAREIAKRLGRTYDAVMLRAKQLKISVRIYGEGHHKARHSDAIVEEARRLHEEGEKPRAIAKRLGVPYQTIGSFVGYNRCLGPPIEYYF
jgi:hypothetical protein